MTEVINWWMASIADGDIWQRLLLFFVTWLLLWLPLTVPIAIKLKWIPFQPLTAAQKLPLLGPLYIVAPLVMWGVLTAEDQDWTHYGFLWHTDQLLALLLGLVIAVMSLMLVFGWEWSQGWISWNSRNQRKLLVLGLPILLLALWIGATEELIFRGFVQVELQAKYGLWLAGVIASVIFALLHLIWERQQTWPQIPGLILMGLVLTLAKWTDRDYLGLAIGLHAGWVWGLTCIDAAQLVTYEAWASPWVVGWYRQPLAGAAGIICLLVTAFGLLIVKVA